MNLRPVESDADHEAWAAVKSAVIPGEPVTGEELRRLAKPERLLLLAEVDAALVGCGIASPSSFAGSTFIGPRVLPEARGRGVGALLLDALSDHAVALERPTLVAHVDGADDRSLRFARRFGFAEFDRQVQQTRRLLSGEDPSPPSNGLLLGELGVELVSIAQRPDLLEQAWRQVAVEAYADIPLPEPIEVPLDEWLREEATLAEGSFVALRGDEVVGYAGLLRLDARLTAAEHGLTAVRRDLRRRGVATALKRAQIAWAAASGLQELVTWTQRVNGDMQRLNERLGYLLTSESITMRAESARYAHSIGS